MRVYWGFECFVYKPAQKIYEINVLQVSQKYKYICTIREVVAWFENMMFDLAVKIKQNTVFDEDIYCRDHVMFRL